MVKLFSILLLFGCSSKNFSNTELPVIEVVDKIDFRHDKSSSNANSKKYTDIDIFYVGSGFPINYKIIANLTIGPGRSSSIYEREGNCTYEEVLNTAAEKARELGGDAFKIIELKRPYPGNSCFRITGLALKSDE